MAKDSVKIEATFVVLLRHEMSELIVTPAFLREDYFRINIMPLLREERRAKTHPNSMRLITSVSVGRDIGEVCRVVDHWLANFSEVTE